MDVFGFLKLRLNFLKQLHEKSSAPFILIKEQIEDGVSPYEPYYSEDEEPPYLEEWIEAEESIQVLGYSCVSMLATSLHLFFKTWENELGTPVQDRQKTLFNKKGWLFGYEKYFSDLLDINYEGSPVDLVRLEEIVRSRNIVQHPSSITLNTVEFTRQDLKAIKNPFFSSEIDRRMSKGSDRTDNWLFTLNLHIPPDKFEEALNDVLIFSEWLDRTIHEAMGWSLPTRTF